MGGVGPPLVGVPFPKRRCGREVRPYNGLLGSGAGPVDDGGEDVVPALFERGVDGGGVLGRDGVREKRGELEAFLGHEAEDDLEVLMAILAGVGTAGVPGGSLPLIVILLQTVDVPPLGITIILGIAGSYAGTYVAGALGLTSGLMGFVVSIVCAIVLLFLYEMVRAKTAKR